MPFIKVWFYNPVNDTEGWFNHVVARLDGPFCHCEVQFPDRKACTIYMGTKVVFKERLFDPEVYTGVTLTCSQAQLTKAYKFAQEQFDTKVCFDTLAMSVAVLPSIMSYRSSGTFCSKLCAEILVAGDILEPGVNTRKLSPSALHRMLQPASNTPIPKASSGTVTAIDFK